MKKFILSLFLLGYLLPAGAQQTVDTDSIYKALAQLHSENDSLKQNINYLMDDKKQQKVKDKWAKQAKYINLSFVNQSYIEKDRSWGMKSKYGFALTFGRTYYLHKKPLFGMVRFGLDWSFLDINFASYDDSSASASFGGNYYFPEYPDPDYEDEYEESSNMYQAEIGMQIGPSVTVNPIKSLMATGYFRVTPSCSMTAFDDFLVKYGTFFSCGGAVSYKVISLGIEGRWSRANYRTGSTRFYIGFRF